MSELRQPIDDPCGDPLRLAILRDYRAEGWQSMDLCADELLKNLSLPGSRVAATDVAPEFCRLSADSDRSCGTLFNMERLFNRHWLLPRHLHRIADSFDYVHVVDHSYAHATLAVPEGRAGVYCHDVDAFRCLLDRSAESRPWWFRRLAARTLRGMRRAAIVFHNTAEVGRQLVDFGLIPAERLIHAPLGVSDEFTSSPETPPPPLPESLDVCEAPFLLHVGSNIPRKRIDVALDVLAVLLKQFSTLKLVQVGGPWQPAASQKIRRLGLEAHVVQVRDLTRSQLAELYRRAAVVLVPSSQEGFGLPVVEAMACGAAVVASDITALREAGGDAAVYQPVGDIAAWSHAVGGLLAGSIKAPPLSARIRQAAKFSWSKHSAVIADAYLALRNRP